MEREKHSRPQAQHLLLTPIPFVHPPGILPLWAGPLPSPPCAGSSTAAPPSPPPCPIPQPSLRQQRQCETPPTTPSQPTLCQQQHCSRYEERSLRHRRYSHHLFGTERVWVCSASGVRTAYTALDSNLNEEAHDMMVPRMWAIRQHGGNVLHGHWSVLSHDG